MLVVGDREVEQGTVTVRTRGSKDTQTVVARPRPCDACSRETLQPARLGLRCDRMRLERGGAIGYTAALHKEEATLPTSRPYVVRRSTIESSGPAACRAAALGSGGGTAFCVCKDGR